MDPSNLTQWIGIIGTVIGVMLGFALYKIDDWRRHKGRRKKIIRALIAELSTIHNLFLKESKEGLLELHYTHNFPFQTASYDSIKSEIIGEIKEETLSIINNCYFMIKEKNRLGMLSVTSF